MTTANKIALGAFAGFLALVYAHKNKGTSGIGAARKRRIYKELSLAQQAGVDFTKPYEELDDDEISALEQVSHDTGFTETYYKSLQKAYNAISGIGESYDVVNADGNTVLTWTEDPDGSQPHTPSYAPDTTDYDYLRYAHVVEDDIRWAEENKQQERDDREKRLAAQRKRLAKAGRSSQMQLFGCGYADTPDYSAALLNRYLSCHRIYDAQVALNDTNSKGHVSVLCGDDQGGRDFYLAKKNLPILKEYCRKHNCEYEEFYLPDDCVNGCGTGALNARDLLEPDLLDYIRRHVDEDDMRMAYDVIGEDREPLYRANSDLYDQIISLTEDWCTDNAIDPDSIWDVVDAEDIFWEL